MTARLQPRLLVALMSAACAPAPPQAAQGKNARVESCSYDVQVATDSPLVLDVAARCNARGPLSFVASERPSVPHISGAVDAAGRALRRKGASFSLPEEAVTTASIRYQVDLDATAKDAESFDVALRSGRSLIAPASTWLLRPEPHSSATGLTLRVRTPKNMGFTTGLTSVGNAYQMGAHELPVSTYAIFGPRQLVQLALPGPNSVLDPAKAGKAEVEVAFADGALGVSSKVVSDWIERSASAVADFWGGFPVPRALVVVIPAADRRGVVHGKVLPESSPGIVIVMGEHSDEASLNEDWVLVHELFHLGFPSFQGEAKWLDEGLATYYEPIIRARAGNKTEADVWAEFVRAMPQGVPAMEDEGLENTSSYRGIYWGGAIVSLLADLEIRKHSGGKRGLEAGLRRVLQAGGNASEVWSMERAVRVCDGSGGLGTLRKLVHRYAYRGSPVNLDAVWRELGIVRHSRGVHLRDDAPLSHIRRAIVFGKP